MRHTATAKGANPTVLPIILEADNRPQEIGGYIVTSQSLGAGSFATVHLAFDPAKYRQVACKSIRIKEDHEVTQAVQEARLLMTLRHVRIYLHGILVLRGLLSFD